MIPVTIRKRANQLQPGDRLWPTDRTVVWVGQTVHTPKGKVTVTLERDAGGTSRTRDFHFGSSTVVSVHA